MAAVAADPKAAKASVKEGEFLEQSGNLLRRCEGIHAAELSARGLPPARPRPADHAGAALGALIRRRSLRLCSGRVPRGCRRSRGGLAGASGTPQLHQFGREGIRLSGCPAISSRVAARRRLRDSASDAAHTAAGRRRPVHLPRPRNPPEEQHPPSTGGKKGVDMCGMSDLGGVKFFTITLETPNGDMALMDAVLEGG